MVTLSTRLSGLCKWMLSALERCPCIVGFVHAAVAATRVRSGVTTSILYSRDCFVLNVHASMLTGGGDPGPAEVEHSAAPARRLQPLRCRAKVRFTNIPPSIQSSAHAMRTLIIQSKAFLEWYDTRASKERFAPVCFACKDTDHSSILDLYCFLMKEPWCREVRLAVRLTPRQAESYRCFSSHFSCVLVVHWYKIICSVLAADFKVSKCQQ